MKVDIGNLENNNNNIEDVMIKVIHNEFLSCLFTTELITDNTHSC